MIEELRMSETVEEDSKRPLEEELYPYGRDGTEYVAVVTKMVSAYIDVYYQNDSDVLRDSQLAEFWDGENCNISDESLCACRFARA